MVNRDQLKKLSKTRLKETKALFEKDLYDGVNYLYGYVIELALKARICRILDLPDYPESGDIGKSFKIHKLPILIKLAGLEKKFEEAQKNNPKLLSNWSILSQWSETNRYSPVGTSLKRRAKKIIDAIEDKNDGVLTWIKKYW